MLQNRELGKDQATEGSAGHSKECEFYSKHDGQPLEDVKIGCYMMLWIYRKARVD